MRSGTGLGDCQTQSGGGRGGKCTPGAKGGHLLQSTRTSLCILPQRGGLWGGSSADPGMTHAGTHAEDTGPLEPKARDKVCVHQGAVCPLL